MSAPDQGEGRVECVVKLMLGSEGIPCAGTTLEELRKQAVAKGRKKHAESYWEEAVLVCADDGDEAMSMESLKRKLGKGMDLFFFISPALSSFLERSINMDHVMRNYKQLNRNSNVPETMRIWACDKTRRRDLQNNLSTRVFIKLEDERDLQFVEIDLGRKKGVANVKEPKVVSTHDIAYCRTVLLTKRTNRPRRDIQRLKDCMQEILDETDPDFINFD